MSEPPNPAGVGDAPLTSTAELAAAEFPTEAFECPYCGQMLAPSCRVCVACKQPIDPAHLKAVRAVPLVEPPPTLEPEPAPVRFPWKMFFAVLAGSWIATVLALRVFGLLAGQAAVSGFQLVAAAWVFWDARRRLIAKPVRWGVGTLLLWIVFFPWYLVRRQKLRSPCPFVERETAPFWRVMVLVVFIMFLLAVIVSALGGAAAK